MTTPDTYLISHNPRCTKSRATLALLEERNLNPEIRLYQEHPFSKEELTHIAACLNQPLQKMCRFEEPIAKEMALTSASSDDEILTAIAKHPILLQRPLVLKNNQEAIIGRPPENLFAIVKE